MVLIDPLHEVQSTIIEVLATNVDLTIAELQEQIESQNISITAPSLYRLVSQLIDAQVIIRQKGKHVLHLGWVQNFIELSELMENVYIGNSLQVYNLPTEDGQRFEYSTSCLLDLEKIWFHLYMELIETVEGHTWYEYNAHPWHFLLNPDSEYNLYKKIINKGVHVHFCFGNNTFLDTYGIQICKKSLPEAHVTVSSRQVFTRDGYILIVYGDYILECFFPTILKNHFNFFFQTINSIEEFDPLMYSNIFKMKSISKIFIRKSSAEAQKLRQSFLKII